MPENEKPTRTMDIVHADDQRKPDGSAKPIIVTNRPLIQDPMMVVPLAIDGLDQASAADSHVQQAISPIQRADSSAATADTDGDGITEIGEANAAPVQKAPLNQLLQGKSLKTTPDQLTPPAEPVPPTPPATPAEELTVPVEPEFAVGDDMIDADSKKKTEQAEADKTDDEIEELVEQKKFFLPINAALHRRSRHVAVFGFILIVILVLAWLDISLDAGLISISGVSPLTHFF